MGTKHLNIDSISNHGYSVQQTKDGGYILLGKTLSIVNSESDVYLIKTDGNGNELWSKTFGGVGDESGNSIQQTSDGGYIITGYTLNSFGLVGESYVYLIKTDGSGNEQWSQTFGGIVENVVFLFIKQLMRDILLEVIHILLKMVKVMYI